jgi:AbrB family looped-hinge helix DNA binding protein
LRATVSTTGQIVLPAELRQRDDIEPGQEFEVERLGTAEYRLARVSDGNDGLVGRAACLPQKGYFVAVDSEWTAPRHMRTPRASPLRRPC